MPLRALRVFVVNRRQGSTPTSQRSTFSVNCAFCSAIGAFIPIGVRAGPATCALNIAASPKKAARPFPTVRVAVLRGSETMTLSVVLQAR